MTVTLNIQNDEELRPKKETLEEVAERLYPTTIDSFTDTGIDLSETERIIFKEGVKWQQEQNKNKYSEEEALELLNNFNKHTLQLQKLKLGNSFNVKEWFEQFKKK